MSGLVRSWDVLVHAPTIVAGFGLRAFLRAAWACFRGRPCTFLSVVVAPSFAMPSSRAVAREYDALCRAVGSGF